MAREKETKVLRRTENLKQILESKPEEYGNFYRTKDIYLTAFLISRGYDWSALEEVEVITSSGRHSSRGADRPQKLIFFLFEDSVLVQKLAINYFNTNKSSLNVNANAMISAYHAVRSVITDPPF